MGFFTDCVSQLRKYKEKVTTNTGYAGTVMY